MKKAIFAVVCVALMVSCASKRAAFVDSTITEAKTLQEIAKINNLATSAESLIQDAEKQNDERQTEQAFVLADEAVLVLHSAMLKQEEQALGAEKKKAADSLDAAKESLEIYRDMLRKLRNEPKQQVVN